MLRKLEQRKAAQKDEQIKILQRQLAAAKEANANASQINMIIQETSNTDQ